MFPISAILAAWLLFAPAISPPMSQALSIGPSRIGDAARKLSTRDITDIERALASAGKAEKLFMIIGGETPQHSYLVYGYLSHESGTVEFRRCEKVMITRPSSRARWVVSLMDDKGGGTYAQVAIAGQSMDSITSDRDISKPFRVTGDFPDADLISVVRFIRSGAPPTSRYGRRVPDYWPIDSISRALDGESIAVSLMAPNGYSGVGIFLNRDGDTWRVKQIYDWVY